MRRSPRFLLVYFSLFLSTLGAADFTEIQDQNTVEILTPSLSSRQTAKLRLENGLEAYIISDPDIDKAAAGLSVQAGSWSNPIGQEGIAHFLEHMLFLGTTRYPNESEYQRYITDNGGVTNAYTSVDHTAYMFSVNPDAFEQGLDRFSWFFREPLFNPSGVARELQIIDQEFEQYRNNDHVREYYVRKQIANPEHPLSRFSVGNKHTLEKVSQEQLRDFYEGHYSANLMHLVVIASEPLDTLVQMVADKFSPIENRGHSATVFPDRMTRDDTRGKVIYIEPIKELRQMSLTWELPTKLAGRLDEQPDRLVGYILGHEGKESLLAYLKSEGLATGLAAGGSDYGSQNATFALTVDLTEKGVDEADLVAEYCHQAIRRLRDTGIPRYIFDEVQKMQTMAYQYQQRESSYHAAMAHARLMLYEPLETYPMKSQVIQKYDPDLARELIEALTPETCLYSVMAPAAVTNVRTDRKEQWFGTPYSVTNAFDQQLDDWRIIKPHLAIGIPGPNPLIPDQLDLKQKEFAQTHPRLSPVKKLVDDEQYGELFWAADDRFQVPKVQMSFDLMTPRSRHGNVREEVLTELLLLDLADQLNSYRYQATLAGLDIGLDMSDNGGIRVTLEGYSENALKALSVVWETIASPTLSKERFQTYRSQLKRKYDSFEKEPPLKQASELLKSILYEDYAQADEKAQYLQEVDFDDLTAYSGALFHTSYLQAMVYGNITKPEAKKVWELYRKLFTGDGYKRSEHHHRKVAELSDKKGPYYLERTRNVAGNGLILALHNGRYDFKRRAAQQVMAQALQEPFFTELRTKQKTGYIVYNTAQEIERQLYSFFAVQSGSHHLRDLLARFELFIEEYLQEVDRDPQAEERFNQLRNALTVELDTPPSNMAEMTSVLRLLAFEYDGDFAFVDKRIEAIQELTFAEYLELVRSYIGRDNLKRLAVMIKGRLPREVCCDYKRAHSVDRLRNYSTYVDRGEVNISGG